MVLSKRIAVRGVVFAVGLPAFDKSRREIFWSRRDPPVDDSGRKKSAALNFVSVGYGIAANFSSIKPDEFVVSACWARKLQNFPERNIYAEFLFQLAPGRFVIAFPGGYMASSAGVPLQRMSIFPTGALLQINVVYLVENQYVDGTMEQVIPMHIGALGIS